MTSPEELLNRLNFEEKIQTPKLPKLDFKSGIIRVGDVSSSMDQTFKHGKKRGDTTHITAVDMHFTWKRGELTCVTGWPQGGKTEFTLFLMLLKAMFDGWKWAVFSPENHPADELFDTLIHTYIGQSTDPKYPNQMTMAQYQKGKEFIHEHFIYVYPKELHTPETIREYFAYIASIEKIDGTLKDPWNKMVHTYAGREDQYLATQFPIEQRFAREQDLCSIITAHPKSPGRLEQGKPLPIPDQYWISGGQMWDNMFDNILAVHRPEYHLNKGSTAAQFISHKIKKQKLVGIPGSVDFDFERKSNQYLYNGASPLIKPGLQTTLHPNPGHNLPESDFEKNLKETVNDNPF
jgi:hypothetical protein